MDTPRPTSFQIPDDPNWTPGPDTEQRCLVCDGVAFHGDTPGLGHNPLAAYCRMAGVHTDDWYSDRKND